MAKYPRWEIWKIDRNGGRQFADSSGKTDLGYRIADVLDESWPRHKYQVKNGWAAGVEVVKVV